MPWWEIGSRFYPTTTLNYKVILWVLLVVFISASILWMKIQSLKIDNLEGDLAQTTQQLAESKREFEELNSRYVLSQTSVEQLLIDRKKLTKKQKVTKKKVEETIRNGKGGYLSYTGSLSVSMWDIYCQDLPDCPSK